MGDVIESTSPRGTDVPVGPDERGEGPGLGPRDGEVDPPSGAEAAPVRGVSPAEQLVRVADASPASRDLAARRSGPGAAEVLETTLDVWAADLPSELDPRLVMAREPYGPRAAAFRGLRHRVMAAAAQVLAVTSAEPHEGKTTCAVNLAMALAEGGGARVLLVEANFRTPALARMLGFVPPEGIAAQLAGHREAPEVPWAVVELAGSGVHVLAVDEQALRPLVLDHVAFGRAMASLRGAGYDFILVDTPSVLGGADVNLVADAVDGVLMTTLARRSSNRALRDAIAQLEPTPVLGVVLLDA
jgi:Mrp family chromosome partitioning ATPase